MIDINLHEDTEDFNNNIITNGLHLFLQEVEMAVQIGPNEIWGVPDSINISRYVFNKYVTITQIRNELKNYIIHNCHHAGDFVWNISVETIKNPGSTDLLYIKFSVSIGDDTNDDFVQKFLLGA